MSLVELILVVLLALFVLGGFAVSNLVWILAALVLLILLARLTVGRRTL